MYGLYLSSYSLLVRAPFSTSQSTICPFISRSFFKPLLRAIWNSSLKVNSSSRSLLSSSAKKHTFDRSTTSRQMIGLLEEAKRNTYPDYFPYSRNFLPQCSYSLTWSFGLTSHSLTGVVTSAPHFGHLANSTPPSQNAILQLFC